MVLVPLNEHKKEWTWTNLRRCVWSGPKWFNHQHQLQPIEGYQLLQTLFTSTLGLQATRLDEFLVYLVSIKESGIYETKPEEEAKISLLYDTVYELTEQGAVVQNREAVR
jgi:hypothetical protein